jgi:hypothetical protein
MINGRYLWKYQTCAPTRNIPSGASIRRLVLRVGERILKLCARSNQFANPPKCKSERCLAKVSLQVKWTNSEPK